MKITSVKDRHGKDAGWEKGDERYFFAARMHNTPPTGYGANQNGCRDGQPFSFKHLFLNYNLIRLLLDLGYEHFFDEVLVSC